MSLSLKPDKKLGQHFLQDIGLVRRMVNKMNLGPKDRVWEIGPGPGILTEALLESDCAEVTAVELDPRWVNYLKARFHADSRLTVMEADFLRVEIPDSSDGHLVRIVGNLPYYITSPILFHLLDQRRRIADAMLMVQKEVADRLASQPGSKIYGIPSVFFQTYGQVEKWANVPAGAFQPVPEVDSAVVYIRFLPDPVRPISDEALFRRLVRTAFGQRRKMLRNTLKPFLDKELLTEPPLDLTRRPETLSPEEFIELVQWLSPT